MLTLLKISFSLNVGLFVLWLLEYTIRRGLEWELDQEKKKDGKDKKGW